MLVLTRQTNESIMIGDQIELMVVEIRGDKVRIGINAPVDIPVYRKEVYNAIQRENIEAAKMPAGDLRKVEELLRESVENKEKKNSEGREKRGN